MAKKQSIKDVKNADSLLEMVTGNQRVSDVKYVSYFSSILEKENVEIRGVVYVKDSPTISRSPVDIHFHYGLDENLSPTTSNKVFKIIDDKIKEATKNREEKYFYAPVYVTKILV